MRVRAEGRITGLAGEGGEQERGLTILGGARTSGGVFALNEEILTIFLALMKMQGEPLDRRTTTTRSDITRFEIRLAAMVLAGPTITVLEQRFGAPRSKAIGLGGHAAPEIREDGRTDVPGLTGFI